MSEETLVGTDGSPEGKGERDGEGADVRQNCGAPGAQLVIISGPSGVGKDTIIDALREQSEHGDYYYVVTCTTRARRPGEVDGVSYRFLDREQLAALKTADELELRQRNAAIELARQEDYDYVVVNETGHVARTARRIDEIIAAEHARHPDRKVCL